jgi:ankyrin repeat protein
VTGRAGSAIIGGTARAGRALICGAAALLALLLALSWPGAASAQNYSDGYKFLQAVEKKDGATVIEMLDAPGSTVINARDVTSGRTGLHIAVERRDIVWINFLTGRGANPNLSDSRGVTPLMRATQLGFHDGISALVKAGARVDEANSAGETPLISAVHRRDSALVRALLEAGADPDRPDNSGRSARDYAMLRGAPSALLAEIERNADESGQRRAASGETYGPSL